MLTKHSIIIQVSIFNSYTNNNASSMPCWYGACDDDVDNEDLDV